ncbi:MULTISPECIES: BlaI/MecI/CopY family transcriptional regulator [Paenibacillus]|mgnify:CR=1 FL=1|uniref:BlaI/MecI/CopY family transcriptional regulator n=1 Tax=Paenibacillus validus TaxID=44253 RepID=A0A7X3CVI1_9BACL|nr:MULTISPECIES: BlaI/MecI/CopY family transcriptional regulator [Paenibacillus]MUG73826.1 BlaI/MecI/CopY family transcriptional regulator [Paenibacillus validus]
MKIHSFKFYEKGLKRFFGPLESKVLDILWTHPNQSIKEVQKKLEQQDEHLNFNTVMTVMNRLVDKGVLMKKQAGRASVYEPVHSKEHFLDIQSREIAHELLEDFGPLVVNHMLDALEEADAEMIEKLEQKIKDLKKER